MLQAWPVCGRTNYGKEQCFSFLHCWLESTASGNWLLHSPLPIWWTWVWTNSGSWWWTGKLGVLQFGAAKSRTQLSNWTEPWLSAPSFAHTSFFMFWYQFFKKIFLKYLFIWLHQVLGVACKLLVAACRIWFPDHGLNLNPLYWECGVLATWPPGESPLNTPL